VTFRRHGRCAVSIASAMTHDYRATRAFASARPWVEATMARLSPARSSNPEGIHMQSRRFATVASALLFAALGPPASANDGAFMGDEPNATSTWIPLNDHPSDKATWTIRATVPAGLSVIANGQLRSQRTRNGKSTFVWNEPFPMANYLVTADVGNWIIRTGRTPNGIPETVAADPTLPAVNGKAAVDFFFDTTAEATDLWSETFGPYPFDSTGAIADNANYNGQAIGFSLETQTRPLDSNVRSESTIAHELAHQWFGDSVAVQTWPNIWLNEGFATFSHYLWDEHRGVRTAHEAFLADYSRDAASAFWTIKVTDPQGDTMFANAVYRRGAMTLKALREKIGDDPFFRILRNWTAEHAHGNATNRAVHRPGAADLRTGPERLLPDLALHDDEAHDLVSAALAG
jgi:peptidase M1-like protein